jgi:YggT family protein
VIAATIGIYVLWVFIGLLLIRMIMSYVMIFSPNYRPAGGVAAVLEIVYSTTDPPLKALGRVIPPLRLGRVSLDLAFIVLYAAAYVLIAILSSYT